MSEIQPALTAEGWAYALRDPDNYDDNPPPLGLQEWDRHYRNPCVEGAGVLGRHHEAAAVALYGQPFGFTWEDVEEIRALVEIARYHEEVSGSLGFSIAARIAALLPPRGP